MALISLPIMGMIVAIATVLVFSLPQAFQASFACVIRNRFPGKADFYILFALPFTSLLTWFSWDYLTPSFFGYGAGEDWNPHEHGLTLKRYLIALAIQTLVSVFSYLFWKSADSPSRRNTLVTTTLLLSMIGGIIFGLFRALSSN